MKKTAPGIFLAFLSPILFIPIAFGMAAVHLEVYHNPTKVIRVDMQKPSFVIALAENPTTGYRCTAPLYNSKLLTLVQTQYLPSPSQLVGAGGFKRWTFEINPEAVQSGLPFETSITLTYARAWAAQDNPKTVGFTVMYTGKHQAVIQK